MGGGLLADSPGFNQPSLEAVTIATLADCFPEVREKAERCAWTSVLLCGLLPLLCRNPAAQDLFPVKKVSSSSGDKVSNQSMHALCLNSGMMQSRPPEEAIRLFEVNANQNTTNNGLTSHHFRLGSGLVAQDLQGGRFACFL